VDTIAGKFYMKDDKYPGYKEGDRIEISPDSWGVAENMAKLVARHGGAGLMIDYGQDHVQGDTLRVNLGN
jgi:NADH dehydrogenase [ubiquinone] 1 alpha subcomplex assembly factor 7